MQNNEKVSNGKVSSLLAIIRNKTLSFIHICESLIKIIIISKKCPELPSHRMEDIVILANGPSASDFVKNHLSFLHGKKLLTVNFSVRSNYFTQLKPDFHVVADPILFANEEMSQIFDELAKIVTWKLTLFIPSYSTRYPLWKTKSQILKNNQNISIVRYNLTKIDGPNWFVSCCLQHGWGLPTPRNVLVPSIAHCMHMNFKNIYLTGVDHSWIKLLWVNENNEVMIDDKHFYDPSVSSGETIHKSAPLYLTLESIALILQAYQKLNQIAKKKGCRIINITPGSYIDVFDREKI